MQSISLRVRLAVLSVACAAVAYACTSSTPTEVDSEAGKSSKLDVSPIRIDFGSSGSTASFTFTNTTERAVEWSASESASWLALDATSGTLFGNASRTVRASVQRGDLASGIHTTSIELEGSRGAGSATVSVSVTVPSSDTSPARLEVAPVQVDFGSTATSASVTLTNSGDSALTWTASESAGWLALGASSGSLAARSSRTLALAATRADMAPGAYSTGVTFSAGVAGTVTEAVAMTVPDAPEEPQDPEAPQDPQAPQDPEAPQDPQTSVMLSGTVVGQFDGRALSGVSVRYAGLTATTDASGFFSIPGEPTTTWGELSLSGSGIHQRRTYAKTGGTRWQAVPGSFDMSAFTDVARSDWASHTIRWVNRPTVYVDTRPEGFQAGADLEQWISEVRSQAGAFVSSWTGGAMGPADVIVTSNPPSDFTPGTIVLHFSESSSDYANSSSYIGYTRVSWGREGSISASAVWLRYVRYADRPAKRTGILGHELGHAMGMGHMSGTTASFMAPSIGTNTDLSAFDRLAANLLYSRAPGNSAPDTDSSDSARGALVPSRAAQASEWLCRDEEDLP